MTSKPAPSCRDQIIESLKLIGSIEAQLAYERTVPIAQVQNEVFASWFMGFLARDIQEPFPEDQFSQDEIALLWKVDDALEQTWELVKGDTRPIAELQHETYWIELARVGAAAMSALLMSDGPAAPGASDG